jgi:hypothetical protein
VKTLGDQEVRDQTIEVFRYLVSNKEAEQIVATLMNKVFLRQDCLDNLTELLVKSASSALNNQRFHDMFVDFFSRLVHSPKLKQGVMQNFVYSPTVSLFTFGFSDGTSAEMNKEQNEWERKMQEKRDQIARTYIEDRTERNRYRGFTPVPDQNPQN